MHVQDRDNRSRKSVSFTSLQLESVNQVKEVEGTGKEVGMANISSLDSPVLQLRYLNRYQVDFVTSAIYHYVIEV